MMKNTWIVVASAEKAFIYGKTENADQAFKPGFHFTLQKKLEYPVDLTNMERSNHHNIEHERFAKELTQFLEKSKANFEALIICADAQFQGHLNKSLPSDIKKMVKHYINKDYVPICERKNGGLKIEELKELKNLIL